MNYSRVFFGGCVALSLVVGSVMQFKFTPWAYYLGVGFCLKPYLSVLEFGL